MEARGILERLIRIPSPTGNEQAAAQALAVWCRDAGLEIPEDHMLVRSMAAAMQAASLEPRISSWRAASDAGFLVHGAGIPCVLFGPGDIEQAAHRPDEWVGLEDLDAAQRVFEHLMLSG